YSFVVPNWDWSVRRPVIHFSFSSMGYKEVGLEAAIARTLDMKATEMGIKLEGEGISHRFQDFLKKAARQNPVVLLIDEYDKPLIDYLEKDGLSTALAHQKILKSFYSIIKDNDAHIHFLLITGVSKFSKVGVFSDLNNLLDISLHPNYAALTGITEEELETYFGMAIDEHEAEHNTSGLRQKIQETIPCQLFTEAKENLYHALIHLLFTYLGQYIQSEVSVLRGRLDAVVQTASHAYIFEFKLDEGAKAALEQIRQKDYATPYRISGKQVVAVGVNFSSEYKAIKEWEMAEL
ncbi:MAG: AAA family ATPase, partial [Phaeodactylibacter sp.]|nr:AAA family ATPase [Phaeodactylibacter sp.]